MSRKRYTRRKWMGDDKFSWAIFDKERGNATPILTGMDSHESKWRTDKLNRDHDERTQEGSK